ncbi:MAG: HEAT repeat domain-containing protein [Opitutaceae bacterium]|nr:HEAT repeat domain-containing protein [Opitutaceae bacterium]
MNALVVIRCAAVLALGLGAALPVSAYKEVAPPANVVLPKPRSAVESLAAIKVPAGFEVELVAAEPHVLDPIDFAWGADGRLWIVEMVDYPRGLDGRGQPGGRIRVLESTRRDGRFDRATLFADGLRSPTAVLPWRDGVLVVAVPNILLLRDTDGDGRADQTTVLFRGLAEGNEQHLSNGLQWSLDGWLHLANGESGGKILSEKTGRTLDVGRRDFRISPETGEVEMLVGASQFGRSRDDWGNWFGGNNSNPLWHYALEERYFRRNPHLVPPNALVTLGARAGAARVFPASETLARFNDPHGFNHFTSACSPAIYRDDFLGAEFAGNIFVCEPVHNLVHREIVRPVGATFVGERAATEKESEFFASADPWSRFTSARAGPDGALYIADMYRLAIEHPQWIPAAWQKLLGDLRAGADKGRIYRVRPKGQPLRAVPDLARADAAGLVAALESPSGVVRDLAQQQIAWRQEKEAVPLLDRVAGRSPRAETRAQALWCLHSIGALVSPHLMLALADPHPGVRRQAVRLSEFFASTETEPDLLRGVVAMATDADAAVRQQAAYTLGEWKSPVAGEALARLLRTETDRFVKAAVLSSALAHADTLMAALLRDGGAGDALLVEVATVTENARALTGLLAAIGTRTAAADFPGAFASLAQLLDWLQRNNKTLAQLQRSADEPMRQALAATDEIFSAARRVAVDARAAADERVAAVRILGRNRSQQTEDLELVAGLLEPRVPTEVQVAAVQALGRMNRPVVPERVLAGWRSHGAAVRTAVIELVTSRVAWSQVLLDHVEANPAMLAQIDPAQRQRLTHHIDARLADRAVRVFQTGIDGNRQAAIDRMLVAMSGRKGDAGRGAGVFEQNCRACHAFGGMSGGVMGPDLAVVKDRSAPYLVTHILDPNRAVEDRYMMHAATLLDGRSLAGMLAAESSHSVTLRGLDGVEHVILRNELRLLVSSGRSLMPEGLEAAVEPASMADLVAFLAGAPAATP